MQYKVSLPHKIRLDTLHWTSQNRKRGGRNDLTNKAILEHPLAGVSIITTHLPNSSNAAGFKSHLNSLRMKSSAS